MFQIRYLLFLIVTLVFLSYSPAQVWTKQAKSGNAGLIDIVFISKAEGFAIGSGKVLKTVDTGNTWTQILTSYNRFSGIAFADSKNGYIIGYDDLVLKTTDGGNSWNLKNTGNSNDDLLTLFTHHKDTLFITGSDDLDSSKPDNYFHYSYDGGSNWGRKSLSNIQPITSMWMKNKNKGMISTLSAGVMESTNGFSSYSYNTNPGIQINDTKVIKDSVVVLVGNGGKISRSNDYGKTYTSVASATSENLNGLHFANDSVGMACGDKGTMLRTTNSGLTWTKMVTNTTLHFEKVFFINAFHAWAVANSTVGDSMDIFRFEDKSCKSSFVHVPRDTVICDKYEYEVPFQVNGKNKPTWTINDILTKLERKNDSMARIFTIHEGKFIIAYELQNCEDTWLDTTTVFFWKNPKISVFDSVHCGSVNDIINFSCFACRLLWSNGKDDYSFVATQPGKFWVQATNYCKTISDTFTLDYLPYVQLDIGRDTLLCNQSNLKIELKHDKGFYKWNDGSTNSFKTIDKPGIYSVNFKNKCNDVNDTIHVMYKDTPTLSLGKDSIYCQAINHPLHLDSVLSVSTISWWDGSTTSSKTLSSPGTYYATVRNECGEATDSLQLGILNGPTINLGRDTIYCQPFTHSIALNPGVPEYKIEWGDGSNALTRSFNSPGIQTINVFNRCGQVRDTVKIGRAFLPSFNLGLDTTYCNPFTRQLVATSSGATYAWNTGDTTPIITVNKPGAYSVLAKTYCGSVSDNITLSQMEAPLVKLGNDTILKKPFIVTLDAENPSALFIWSTGSTSQQIMVDEYGKYWVTVSNICGQSTDSIAIIEPVTLPLPLPEELNVFPNPVSGDMVFIVNTDGSYIVEVFDQFGREVLNKITTHSKHQMDISSLSSGIYNLRIHSNAGLHVFQLIKL